jgi:uncharacterized protein DUF547
VTLLSSYAYAGASHTLFTEILSDYVSDGKVNYKDLRLDKRLPAYIDQLSHTDPATLIDDKERFAFWINAYNAYTLKIICDNYPLKSISELHGGGAFLGRITKTTVWDKKLVTINNKKMTLNDIEHKTIRPEFKDARAHFALVCAAKSCPPLRNEAYEAHTLSEQLNDQGRIFLSQLDENNFDIFGKAANISPIFSWFAGDFGGKNKVLSFLADFLPQEVSEAIKKDSSSWKIRYTYYDWSLNE